MLNICCQPKLKSQFWEESGNRAKICFLIPACLSSNDFLGVCFPFKVDGFLPSEQVMLVLLPVIREIKLSSFDRDHYKNETPKLRPAHSTVHNVTL